jgi:hypothetical protein
MTDEDLAERNRTKLQEAHSAFRRALAGVLADLKASGYRPRIQACWRSPADQQAAKASGHSKLAWGYHNATAVDGSPEALAADVLDDDRPLDPSRDFVFALARSARQHGLETGIDWGLPSEIKRAMSLFLAGGAPGSEWANSDGTPGKLGWDTCHVQIVGISVAKARAGERPMVTA